MFVKVIDCSTYPHNTTVVLDGVKGVKVRTVPRSDLETMKPGACGTELYTGNKEYQKETGTSHIHFVTVDYGRCPVSGFYAEIGDMYLLNDNGKTIDKY